MTPRHPLHDRRGRGRQHPPDAPHGRDRGPGGQRGSLSLELVLLAPALLAVMALVIAGGRAAVASQAVAQAASQAARDATLAPGPDAAAAAARSRATTVLGAQGLDCAPAAVQVDAAALAARPGTPGAVSVTVACTVTWTDLGVPGPGHRTLTATGRAPVDTWSRR